MHRPSLALRHIARDADSSTSVLSLRQACPSRACPPARCRSATQPGHAACSILRGRLWPVSRARLAATGASGFRAVQALTSALVFALADVISQRMGASGRVSWLRCATVAVRTPSHNALCLRLAACAERAAAAAHATRCCYKCTAQNGQARSHKCGAAMRTVASSHHTAIKILRAAWYHHW
jgi:hypothetical protein